MFLIIMYIAPGYDNVCHCTDNTMFILVIPQLVFSILGVSF